MNHKVRYAMTNDRRWSAICSCRNSSPLVPSRQEAEDWEYKHLREVERVQARLANRAPSLAVTLRQYREAEKDPLVSPEDRVLWKQMADELSDRINQNHSGTEQLGLW